VERIEPSESTITQKKTEVIESCEDNLPQKRLAGTNVQRSVSSCSENSDGHVSESSLSEKSLAGDYTDEKCNSVNSESHQESVKTQEEAEKSIEAIVDDEPVLTVSNSSEDTSPAAVEASNEKDGGSLPDDPVDPTSLAENGSRVTGTLANVFSLPSLTQTDTYRCAV